MKQLTSSQGEDDLTTVFVAVPTPDGSEAAAEASELAADLVRRACERAGRDSNQPWHIKVTEGRLAPTDDPAALRRSIRRKLVGEVDAVVALMRNASYGCGREVGWAAAQGIPTLLLHRRGSKLTPHAGGTPPEAPVDIRDYQSSPEMYEAVRQWMSDRRPFILAGAMRRSRPLAVTDPLRGAARSAWEQAGPAERRRVCDALLAPEEQVQALLSNAEDFASARCGLTLDLLTQLGIVVPGRMNSRDWYRRTEVPSLPDDAREGLEEAIATWSWDGPTTLHAVELGLRKLRRDRDLHESGVLQRTGSLGNRFAWKKLLQQHAIAGRAPS